MERASFTRGDSETRIMAAMRRRRLWKTWEREVRAAARPQRGLQGQQLARKQGYVVGRGVRRAQQAREAAPAEAHAQVLDEGDVVPLALQRRVRGQAGDAHFVGASSPAEVLEVPVRPQVEQPAPLLA